MSRSTPVTVKPFLKEIHEGSAPSYLAEVDPGVVVPITAKALEAELNLFLELWRILRDYMGPTHSVTLRARRKFREKRRQLVGHEVRR